MQTQASQQHDQRGGIPGIAMIVSCAASILLSWTPSSIGKDNSAPARVSLTPVRASSAMEAPAAPAQRSSDSTNSPVYAQSDNQAGGGPNGNQNEERVDIATFLVWHVQARNSTRYAYQTVLSGPSRTEVDEFRPSALLVAAPIRNTGTR